jgi:hypothetical protein
MFSLFLVGPLCWLSIFTPPNSQLDPGLLPISMLSFSSYSYPMEYWFEHLHTRGIISRCPKEERSCDCKHEIYLVIII